MGYTLKHRIEIITKNTTIKPDGFSGWKARNLGSDEVHIDGDIMEGVNGDGFGLTSNLPQVIDKTNIRPDVVWDEPIKIVFSNNISTTKQVLIERYIYKQKN